MCCMRGDTAGIMATDVSRVTVNVLTDRDGEADDGGTMWLEKTFVDLTSVYVDSSTAQNRGGALGFMNCTVTLSDVTADFTTATDGGGLYIEESTVACTTCTFTGNYASENGGGAYVADSAFDCISCTFNGATALLAGGGIVLDSYSTAYMSDAFFTLGDAFYGGAMTIFLNRYDNWPSCFQSASVRHLRDRVVMLPQPSADREFHFLRQRGGP